MGRMLGRWAIVLGVPALAVQAGRWDLAAYWLLFLAGAYAYSVAFRPWWPCAVCKGTGTSSHSGLLAWLWPSAFGLCWRCKGAKGKVRLGIRVFQPGRAERVKLSHG